jgi:hypothetical protein
MHSSPAHQSIVGINSFGVSWFQQGKRTHRSNHHQHSQERVESSTNLNLAHFYANLMMGIGANQGGD